MSAGQKAGRHPVDGRSRLRVRAHRFADLVRPGGHTPSPPPTREEHADERRLCPDGYVPRRRRRPRYRLEGKSLVTDQPPEPHPEK